MKRHLEWLKHEMSMQLVNGLYAAYIIVNIIYIFLLGYIPHDYLDLAISFIIFTDPTMIGMVFVGAFMLLEKRSGVAQCIGITPLGAKGYIWCKTISMSVIAIITSMCIAIFYKGLAFDVFGLFLTVTISSMLFTMVGIMIGVYTKSMNFYLVIIGIISTFLLLPAINYLPMIDWSILKVIPTYNVLALIENAVRGNHLIMPLLIVLVLWFMLVIYLTEQCVQNKLFRG